MSAVSPVRMPSQEGEKWLSVKEVSGMLGWSEDTIRRLVRRGELKALRLPGRSPRRPRRVYESLRIALSEVMRFIRRNMA